MKMILNIAMGVLGIVVILLIAAIFIKKEYTIAREIAINKPRVEVYEYIKYVKNQDHYNKWVMQDPKAKKEYSGTDGKAGFSLAWDSENKKVGKGEQQITNVREGERIDLNLHFIKPFEGKATASMITEEAPANSTKLNWVMKGKTPYPMNLMNLFIDGILGKDLETSLQTLKTVLEKR